MDDSAEVLTSLLKCIHNYKIGLHLIKEDDTNCNPICLSHNIFHIELVEFEQCICGTTTDPIAYDYNYFVYEAYSNQVIERLKNSFECKSMMNYLKTINVYYP